MPPPTRCGGTTSSSTLESPISSALLSWGWQIKEKDMWSEYYIDARARIIYITDHQGGWLYEWGRAPISAEDSARYLDKAIHDKQVTPPPGGNGGIPTWGDFPTVNGESAHIAFAKALRQTVDRIYDSAKDFAVGLTVVGAEYYLVAKGEDVVELGRRAEDVARAARVAPLAGKVALGGQVRLALKGLRLALFGTLTNKGEVETFYKLAAEGREFVAAGSGVQRLVARAGLKVANSADFVTATGCFFNIAEVKFAVSKSAVEIATALNRLGIPLPPSGLGCPAQFGKFEVWVPKGASLEGTGYAVNKLNQIVNAVTGEVVKIDGIPVILRRQLTGH